MKKVTIKDVASMAGVSISAVSYILNNSSKKTYADSTIKKVKQAAKTLGYVPNNIAQGMRSQKSKAIGVVSFWSMDNRVFVQTLEGIMNESLNHKYSVVILPVNLDNNKDFSYINYFINKKIDGIILISPAFPRLDFNEKLHIQKMHEAQVPFVIINGSSREPKTNYIYFDYFDTTYTATNYLIEKGYKEITYVSPESHGIYEFEQRRLGYSQAMYLHGLSPKFGNYLEIDKDITKYKAVVTNKSEVAKIILNTAIQKGLSVPRDFVLIAGNTENYSEHLYPPLTTVQIPFSDIGENAVDKLIRIIQGENDEISITLKCKVFLRDTC